MQSAIFLCAEFRIFPKVGREISISACSLLLVQIFQMSKTKGFKLVQGSDPTFEFGNRYAPGLEVIDLGIPMEMLLDLMGLTKYHLSPINSIC